MTAIRRLNDNARADALSEFIGLHVDVKIHASGNTSDHTGTVVAVATRGSIGSPPSTQLILQEDHPEAPARRWRYPIAISSATIQRIEET